ALALLVCGAMTASSTTVVFNAPDGVAGTITLRRTANVPGSEPVVLDLEDARAELAPGVYLIELRAPGWWMAPRLATIREDGTIDLAPRRTGFVEGTLTAGTPVTIRFEDPGDASVSGESQCAVQNGAFRCEVPEGKLDLRIGSTGHVPHYRWGVSIAASRASTMGTLTFVPGSSLSGRLQVEEGTLRDTRVTLVRGRETLSTSPSPGGFFQFGPVSAGDYTLSAARKGLVSGTVAVTIRDGHEARVRDPLILARPRSLAVAISPPINPIDRPWMVQLENDRHSEIPGSGAASLDGSWRADNLAPGKYELRIRPDGGPVWHVEEVEIEDPLTTQQVVMKSVRFRAKVRMGSEPLAAKVIFGGEFSPTPIPFRSGESGELQGILPEWPDGIWRVTVRSEQPKIVATLTDVKVTTDDAGVAHLDIVVPPTGIEGEVLDAGGKPAKRAIVNISGRHESRGLTQIDTDEDGKFLLQGLPAGTYGVSASAPLVESPSVTVTIGENDAELASVQLRLAPVRKLSGMVTLPDGRPVAGAKVTAIPVDVPVDLAMTDESTSEGRFTVLVPSAAKTADIRVAAYGFTFSTSRRQITGEPLHIVVDPRGGTLVLDYNGTAGVEPFLWHNGVASSADSLAVEWIARFDEDVPPGRSRLRIPRLEPGEYQICMVPAGEFNLLSPAPSADSCRSVYLAPFAEQLVRLSAP
ncbi:MAG TPA: carboxypeptidase-like regulatory domain-containing protein, partial [Thermoanaerobaculia bacterium]|nr:carboxypeptidase-like regulatory domain-containing protein [Thermoanaerobaculia bacterium]